jgi:hypothetical protein
MRNVILKKAGRKAYPWGPATTVNGAQYVSVAQQFIHDGDAFNQTFGVEQMRTIGEQLAPEWFQKDPDITGSEVVKRLNLGGANAAMGANKFFLQWFPVQRVWQVYDAGDKYDHTDAARTLGKAAQNIRQSILGVYQMATHLIEQMEEEEQQAHIAEFHRVMSELDIVEDWGKHKMRTLLDAVIKEQGPILGNGDGALKKIK